MATITIEVYDMSLGREDFDPVLGQGGDAVDDKNWGYLDCGSLYVTNRGALQQRLQGDVRVMSCR